MNLRKLANKLLGETHSHHACYLPANTGPVSSFLLRVLFSGVKIVKNQYSPLKNLPENAIIIYIIKQKSYTEYLFYQTQMKAAGLPYPEIGLGYHFYLWQPVSKLLKICLAALDHLYQYLGTPDPYVSGYMEQMLTKGHSGLLPLIDRKSFYGWFVKEKVDPIHFLIKMQENTEHPVFLVPMLMFYGKKPVKSNPSTTDILFGPDYRPGIFKRLLILFRKPGKAFVEISEPVNLKLFLDRQQNRTFSIEHLSLVLRRDLLIQLNRHRQSITGPVLKTREELKEGILTNNRLQDFMNNYAKKRKIPIAQARKKANSYIDEIAANYNPSVISMSARVVRWIIKSMFDGISVNSDMLDKVKEISRKGPVIFIPCHKSHLDYIVLPHILYSVDMQCPHVVAGNNLFFWPMAPLLRSVGAFPIRRTFSGAVFYSKVFSEYVFNLLGEGFNIELFFEGGRSRTGKLLMPKLGFFTILLDGFKNKVCQDLIFVPVFIGYDRVIEESSYLNELEGGEKKDESFIRLIKAGKFLKKKYGRIYINFNKPVSIRDILNESGLSIETMSSKDKNQLCRTLGHRLLSSIEDVSVVTPHALVSAAVLNCSSATFNYTQLSDCLETFMTHLSSQKAEIADTLILIREQAISTVIESYVQQKIILPLSGETNLFSPSSKFRINPAKKLSLEYYKNNCISFFVPAAFAALSILELDAFQFSATDVQPGFDFLQEFFSNEFIPEFDKSPEIQIRKTLKAFIDDAILVPHQTLPNTYNLTSAGFRKLKYFSSFLKTYFESYQIVLAFLIKYPKNSLKAQDRIKKIHALGNRMYRRKKIERVEALSKINYENAVSFFISRGLRGKEDTEKHDYFDSAIKNYLKYLT